MTKKRVLEFARADLVTSPNTSTISDIARIMQDGIVGSVFLTDKKGKIEGLITDKAIFDMIANGQNPLEKSPAELMEKIVLVDEDTPALEVLELMKKKNLSRVGIQNKKGEMIGIVSKKKLQFEQLRILKEELGIED